MLDGRFDPALAALFVGEPADPSDAPPLGGIIAGGVIAVATAALLCWQLV